MRSLLFAFLILEAGCGGRPVAAAPPADAAVVVQGPSRGCLAARATRTEANALDHDGHETLALAKLDEANAACPAERATSAALEWKVLAEAGQCARVRAGAADAPGMNDARATCDARAAASVGTPESMRAKMREANAAERAKDYAKAKGLYLAAWAEQHPNARAIESAARMAALAGDPAEARRLGDRALLEAEAAEQAVAMVTQRVYIDRGTPRLFGTTLVLGLAGRVVARDTATGELRVLLDAKAGRTKLSPGGTVAVTVRDAYMLDPATITVWDVLTGERLFQVANVGAYAISADDSRIVVRDHRSEHDTVDHARVLDVATGKVVAKLSGDWSDSVTGTLFFAPDAQHVLVLGGSNDAAYRQWSLAKNAQSAVHLPAMFGVAATSPDGRFFAYLERVEDGAPIHVRDMTTDRDVATWTGRFHSLETLAISNDGKALATGSRNSLRLWDVDQKKQTFKVDTEGRGGDTDSRDPTEFSFSADGKTMVLAGEGLATAWDVATGTQKPLVNVETPKKVLRVVRAPDGVAVVLEDEVRIVPASGEPRSVCRGITPPYHAIIGPTNVAYSPSGKSFACAMSDGWVHVFDTTTWAERAVVKHGAAAPAERPVDLGFSADDKTLTVTSDRGWIAYDAATAAVTSRFAFTQKGAGLAPRHARFDDGSIVVRTWNGGAALYGADGAWRRDVSLFTPAPVAALDAFSADGSTYAVALGKALHVVDVATGAARAVDLPSAAKSLAVSRDGKAIAVAGSDKTISLVVGTTVTPLAGAHGTAVWIAGKSVLVREADDTVALFDPGGARTTTLEIDPDGIVARDVAGFELRGKSEVVCVVGKTYLTRETCADRAKAGLVATWIRSVAPAK